MIQTGYLKDYDYYSEPAIGDQVYERTNGDEPEERLFKLSPLSSKKHDDEEQ